MICCFRTMKLNGIVNKCLLPWDKFNPEMHLKHQDLLIVFADHLLKINEEFKNLKKHEIQNIFKEMN